MLPWPLQLYPKFLQNPVQHVQHLVRDVLIHGESSLGIYTTDQVVSRKIYGFQEWSRHFRLYMPVSSLEKWENAKEDLEKLLSFLSGDKWEIFFRQKAIIEGKQTKLINDANPEKIEKVALFSGGMDSFIGALDLLEGKNKVSFVSHYKRGADKSAQTKLYENLRKKYGDDSFTNYQFYVQPNQQHKNATKEETSRARSFLFLCLGLVIANTLDENIEFLFLSLSDYSFLHIVED